MKLFISIGDNIYKPISSISTISKVKNQSTMYDILFSDYKHLPFKYDKPFNVNPATMVNVDEDYSLDFSLESYDVKVIQKKGNKITFENKNKEVHTIETNENLILKSI